MDMNVKNHLSILGYPVIDKVTKLAGVATSVCFDLYGCIQVLINPGLDKDGKLKDCNWYDIARVERADHQLVMDPPNYEYGATAEGHKGPSEKPSVFKP